VVRTDGARYYVAASIVRRDVGKLLEGGEGDAVLRITGGTGSAAARAVAEVEASLEAAGRI